MYLNQFTNTKKFWYAHCARTMTKRLQWIYVICVVCALCVCAQRGGRVRRAGYKEGKRIPSIFFFLLQNDLIYYSILFQPAKWVLQGIIIQKMSQFHKKLFFPPPVSFTASVPLQNYLQVFKYIHPLLSIESH